jgi:hypothetical protein
LPQQSRRPGGRHDFVALVFLEVFLPGAEEHSVAFDGRVVTGGQA